MTQPDRPRYQTTDDVEARTWPTPPSRWRPSLAWEGLGGGLALIAGWYATAHTTLILAYKGGTLAQVQALCDGGLGELGRAMSASADAGCTQVDTYSMWANAAGFAGLLLALASAVLLAYQAQHKS